MKCKKCGGTNLFPDHGGYYYDAEDDEKRPYVCLDCHGNRK